MLLLLILVGSAVVELLELLLIVVLGLAQLNDRLLELVGSCSLSLVRCSSSWSAPWAGGCHPSLHRLARLLLLCSSSSIAPSAGSAPAPHRPVPHRRLSSSLSCSVGRSLAGQLLWSPLVIGSAVGWLLWPSSSAWLLRSSSSAWLVSSSSLATSLVGSSSLAPLRLALLLVVGCQLSTPQGNSSNNNNNNNREYNNNNQPEWETRTIQQTKITIHHAHGGARSKQQNEQ